MKEPPKVPPGIRNPKTFLEVGGYLHNLLIAEINHGSNPYLAHWKNKAQSLTKQYQAQFTAYAQGAFPLKIPLSYNQSSLKWWRGYEGSDHVVFLLCVTSFLCQISKCNNGLHRLSQSSCTLPFRTRWPTNGQCQLSPCSTVRSATAKQSALLSQWPKLVVITETRGPHEYVPVSALIHGKLIAFLSTYEDRLIQVQLSNSSTLNGYYGQSTIETLPPNSIPTTTNLMMKRKLI